MNKRDFSRVGFHTGAVISWRDTSFKAEISNISLRGMHAGGVTGIDSGEEVEVTLYLTGVSPEIPVRVKGTVVRVDEEGVAIQFQRMDTDSFIHLRNIVANNLGDEEKVMEEFIKFHIK